MPGRFLRYVNGTVIEIGAGTCDLVDLGGGADARTGGKDDGIKSVDRPGEGMFEALTGSRVGKIRHRTRCRGREHCDHLPFRDDPALRLGEATGFFPTVRKGPSSRYPDRVPCSVGRNRLTATDCRRKTLKVPDKSFTHAGGEVAEWSKARPC